MRKKKIYVLLLLLSLVLVGCNNSDSTIKSDNISNKPIEAKELVDSSKNDDSNQSNVTLTESDREKYIKESNIESFVPEGAIYSLYAAYLTGQDLPEVICTYANIYTVHYEEKIIIMQYNESVEKWGIVKTIDDVMVQTMEPLGTLKTKEINDMVVYSVVYDGTGHSASARVLKYNETKDEYIVEEISSEVSRSALPSLDQEKRTIEFAGNSQIEAFIWDGEKFDSIISRRTIDIEADIEIHYSIIDHKVVFANYKPDTTIEVKKGDVIAFIQDNIGIGEVDRINFERGLEVHEVYQNYLTVTEDGMDIELSLRIDQNWFTFYLKSLKEYSSDLNGKKLIYEDLFVYIDEDNKFHVGGDINNYISYLGEGIVSEIEVSPNDENYVLFEYDKDGIRLYYYDDIKDDYDRPHLYMTVVYESKYPTFRGLKIGDSFNRMVELYGETELLFSDDEMAMYSYINSHEDNPVGLNISIDTKTNKVIAYNISSTL